MAARAQRNRAAGDNELSYALYLYAHENDQFDRLMTFIYDEELAEEYRAVEQRFGSRSIERLALRGTPMMSLPEPYRAFLEAYDRAYHTPERIAAEKVTVWEATRDALLRSGVSPAEIARALEIDPGNLSAYLTHGETHRFTLATARAIYNHVA